MDSSSHHSLIDLFEQLGLPAEPDAIAAFIASHQLQPGLKIFEADFWTQTQAEFLRNALLDDAEWAVKVDSLAVSMGAG
jgi:hypothetical protein